MRRTADGRYITGGRTDLLVDAAQPNDMASVAVVVPPPATLQIAADLTGPYLRAGEKQIHLAVLTADIAAATGTPANPKFLFGPLGDVVDVLLVRLDTVPMDQQHDLGRIFDAPQDASALEAAETRLSKG